MAKPSPKPNKAGETLDSQNVVDMSQAADDVDKLRRLRRSGALNKTFMGSVSHHANLQRKATSGDPVATAVGGAVGAGLWAARKGISAIGGLLSKKKGSPSGSPTPSPSPSPAPTGGPSPSPSPSPSPTPTPGPGPGPTPKPSPSPKPGPGPSPSPTPGPTPKPFPSPSPAPVPGASSSPKPGRGGKNGKIAKWIGKASQIKGKLRAKFTREETHMGYEFLRQRLTEAAKSKNKENKENKEDKDSELEEEAPANSVGGGENIAGINPPAGGSKATKKTKKKQIKKQAKKSTKKLNGIAAGRSLAQLARIHGVSVAHLRHQLTKGLRVEREHTSNSATARKIAMDHLMEDPNYYTRLSKMEKNKDVRAKAIIRQRERKAAEKKDK